MTGPKCKKCGGTGYNKLGECNICNLLAGAAPSTERVNKYHSRGSMQAGIHPSQIPEVMEHDKKHGVATEYTSDGYPIFRDRGHKNRYLKLHELVDRME